MLDTRGNRLTYLGHSTFILTTKSGNVILIEPWVMGNPRCPPGLKKLARLDTMLITHCHGDHFDDAVELARTHKPQIVAIYEACIWLGSKGLEEYTRPMSKGGTQRVGEIEVTMTHAFHSSSIIDDDKVIYAGEAAGYVVRLPNGLSIYHAGDTAVFGDMKLIGELYTPDVACLPIGDLFTMGPREAAHAIRLLGVKHVVPMHYATAPYLTGTPDELRALTSDIADLEIHTLQPGESLR
jgi:L-ascorbate metabolism protein UlaG (beta-lactamase superfamily)